MSYVLAAARHAERVRGAVEGRLRSPSGSPQLAASWQRSFALYQLDPGAVTGPRVLSATEVREIRDREEALMRASAECLTRLHDMVRDDNYCVMLADARGVTIDYRVAHDRRKEFRHSGLHIGSCWSEDEEGTCGIANVLADLTPVTVHKTDHFRAAFTTLTCSAAPIFAPDGDLIGVLDASAVQSPDNRESQRIVNRLVRDSATLIENAWFLQRMTSCWILFGHQSRNHVEVRPDLLIAFDESGNVVAANRRASEWMPCPNGPHHIDEIFDPLHVKLRDIGHTGTIAQLRLRANGTVLYARVRTPFGHIGRRGPVARHGAIPLSHESGAPAREHDCSALGPFLRSTDARVVENARIAQRVAGKRLPILLQGETGVGKEVFARAIHNAGARRNRPFIAVSCYALAESRIERELFEYGPGPFEAARRPDIRGTIAMADGGTLFLDEIGDMPLAQQARLLRVLADDVMVTVDGKSSRHVDVNVICATQRDLAHMTHTGAFRDDLYYRLSSAALTLPPLRERHDIAALIDTIFADEAQAVDRPITLDATLAARLATYAWPGNLRQLRTAIRYACAVCDTELVDTRHVDAILASQLLPVAPPTTKPTARVRAHASMPAQSSPIRASIDERERIMAALTKYEWRANAAARALGISRATLYRRVAKLGIVRPHRG